MEEIITLAELGKWPGLKIGSHSVIRHAFDGAVIAAARLHSYATGRDPKLHGVIAEQQDALAIDDLIMFAIHARRLIENTITLKKAYGIFVPAASQQKKQYAPFTRIANSIVHHKYLFVARSYGELWAISGARDIANLMEDFGKPIDAACILVTDRGQDYGFPIAPLIAIFQNDVLDPITDLCLEQNLCLDNV